jgi:TRAP-type C4-dicarboxylate transport system substrate-binding protein
MRLHLPRLRCLLGAALLLAALGPAAAQPTGAPVTLRVVGGLAGASQYDRHEEPFWSTRLHAASGGRIRAEITPFDRTGIRAQEALRLAQLGVTPFGTVPLGVAGGDDPVLAGPDLAGLNGDMAALRRSVAAYRPVLARRLREVHGVELLAVYAYPAQVVLCTQPFAGLADLAGRRVRGASASQADFLLGLGAVPVIIDFGDIVAQLRAGGVTCVITDAASAHGIGLDALTTHVLAQPVSFGLSAFVANAAAWSALAPDVRQTLRAGLAGLERDIWQSAERETDTGRACLIGRGPCPRGARGRLALVPGPADDTRRRETVFREQVLPRWLARCGADCATLWPTVLAPVAAPR